MNQRDLIRKYDIPAPRYTSYPTVPFWEAPLARERWIQELREALRPPEAKWSLYLHIPFCETLCTFCGCNTVITKNHDREGGYIELLHKEWEAYAACAPELLERELVELHLGGGTPTFLSGPNLKRLLEPLLSRTKRDPARWEGSIEVDPRRTSEEQLKALRELGFARVSMGVQDFNPETQRLVNRVQPPEVTERLASRARDLGFRSVNFDLIYGLPKQTLGTMTSTVDTTVELRPDRIALYSYAHVPWIKPAQRLFTEADLPQGEEKRALYEMARDRLLRAGYVEIGMDHFALPQDSLAVAQARGALHRNFMGYAGRRTEVLLGLGVSAISETPGCFHQNEKALPVFERQIQSGRPIPLRGHLLTPEDRKNRERILALMTRWQVELDPSEREDARSFLKAMLDDGLVTLEGGVLSVSEAGRPFLRNACMLFDKRLRAKQPSAKIFSQAI